MLARVPPHPVDVLDAFVFRQVEIDVSQLLAEGADMKIPLNLKQARSFYFRQRRPECQRCFHNASTLKCG